MFYLVLFGFRGFSRSTEVGSRQFLNRCGAIFDTDTTVLVSSDSEVVWSSKHGKTSKGTVERGCRGTLQGVSCPRGAPAPGELGHGMAEPSCPRGSAMAEP